MADDCIPFYEPGSRLTGEATAAVVGKHFVAISGDRVEGENSISIAPPAAAGRVFGVAAWTAAAGERVTILRGSGFVVPVTAAAAIAAFGEVEVDATGAVVPLAAGTAVGFAVTGAADGEDAQIALY